MARLLCAALIVGTIISGCASFPGAAPYDIGALGESLVRKVCADSSPTVKTVPNPHVEGVRDTIEHRACIFGSSTEYVSTQSSDPTGLAMDLEIHQSGSGVPEFLEMGKPVSVAIARLGQPASQTGNTIMYVFGDFEDTFTINAPGGAIRSVAWSWSID